MLARGGMHMFPCNILCGTSVRPLRTAKCAAHQVWCSSCRAVHHIPSGIKTLSPDIPFHKDTQTSKI
eukprot:1159174-Pelagomonas_calceolata.AAC.4